MTLLQAARWPVRVRFCAIVLQRSLSVVSPGLGGRDIPHEPRDVAYQASCAVLLMAACGAMPTDHAHQNETQFRLTIASAF